MPPAKRRNSPPRPWPPSLTSLLLAHCLLHSCMPSRLHSLTSSFLAHLQLLSLSLSLSCLLRRLFIRAWSAAARFGDVLSCAISVSRAAGLACLDISAVFDLPLAALTLTNLTLCAHTPERTWTWIACATQNNNILRRISAPNKIPTNERTNKQINKHSSPMRPSTRCTRWSSSASAS